MAWAASQPIVFEPNRGQSGEGVQFVAHTQEGTLLLTPDAAVLRLPDGSRVALALVWGNRHPDMVAEEPAGGVSHYLRGQDQSRWITDVPHFRRVRYREVYPGIDQVFYGSYAGAAPTLLQGILQVNAIIPANVVPGPQVPVFITIAGVTSQPYIYIAVR